jgi:tetratricopeptide (TPR) repeat protein
LDEYQKALAIDRELVAANPANAFYRRELAVQLGNVGSTMVQLKDKTGALEYFRQALAIYESLVAADPSDVSIRRQLAVGYRNVGVGVGATNRPEASTSFQKATGILAELVAKDPRNGDFRRQLAYTYLATSRYELELDDLPAAVSSASEGIKVAEALVASSPANVSAQNTLALLYSQLGASESKSGARLTPTEPGRKEHWLRAKEAFGKSLGIYSAMKAQGTLNAADAGKLDEVSQEIRKCDVAVDNL